MPILKPTPGFTGFGIIDGIRYGDGKTNRDVIEEWSDAVSTVTWVMRVPKTATFKVAAHYNTLGKEVKRCPIPSPPSPKGGGTATLTISTASNDLHSGIYGGIAPSTAHEAAKLIAKLYDEKNHITIET